MNQNSCILLVMNCNWNRIILPLQIHVQRKVEFSLWIKRQNSLPVLFHAVLRECEWCILCEWIVSFLQLGTNWQQSSLCWFTAVTIYFSPQFLSQPLRVISFKYFVFIVYSICYFYYYTHVFSYAPMCITSSFQISMLLISCFSNYLM